MGAQPDTLTSTREVWHGVPQILAQVSVAAHLATYLDENGNEVRTPEGDAKAAELGARFEAWLLSRDDLNPDQVRLLRMMGEVIKANAADLESVETYHFTMPPFSGMGGRRMVETAFGGAAQLGSVLAGLNAAVFPPNLSGAPPPETPHAPL